MPAKKVRASKRHSQPATKTDDTARIAIQNINVPGRSTRVDATKYAAMRSALLKVLPAKPPGLTQAEMFAAVVPHLPAALFPEVAKAGWWAKTVQLDLEAKRIVARQDSKPLRWHRT